MGKIQFCRICRTERNLKFTTKQLREFNKKQLLSTQETQGSETDKASKKLLRSTPTLGNICNDCDGRIQIFHRLDDGNQSSDSDMEIDVVNVENAPLATVKILPRLNNNDRPETPVIVDDDDMLYNLFMQKVDQQRQQRHLPPPITQLPQLEVQQPQPQSFIGDFNPLYTPPQSNVGSEGDDAKIIEVLTSRESTPASIDRNDTPVLIAHAPHAPHAPDIVDDKGHRIVAIIDLDDGDGDETPTNNDKSKDATEIQCPHSVSSLVEPSNNLLNFIVASAKYQTEQLDDGKIIVTPSAVIANQKNLGAAGPADNDDEEIVFRRVEPQLQISPSKKKNRKSYDDTQLRLVASLSLVSSDSENEEPPTKQTAKEPMAVAPSPSPSPAPVSPPKRFDCKQCKINFPDAESLSVHEQIHQGIKCPVCKFGYSQEQRLVHHMRYKHRTFSGPDLTENPRSAQDSAMTIRLRFMQRKTFYECQLCGRIDEIFKEHKEHIINKHPVESKQLKDPIMNELKCPVCKCKCGTQYLKLSRHLISDHVYGQYKSHLRQLLHVRGWSASRQQEVAKTARIYQFAKSKTIFFECKICHKVVAGFLNHIKHNTEHVNNAPKSQIAITPKKSQESNTVLNKKGSSKLAQVLKSTKTLKKIKQKILQNKDSKSCRKINSSAAPIKKPQILKKPLKSTKSPKAVNIIKPKVSSPKSKETIEKEPIFKIPKSIVKNPKEKNCKPKTKTQKPLETVDNSNNSKRKRIKEDLMIKSKLKKLKVKQVPIKLINLQSYKCKYCPNIIKGFRLYNLHLLNEHKKDEFFERHCLKCRKTFLERSSLETHTKQCTTNISEPCTKQRRKYVKHLQTDVQCYYTTTKVDCTNEDNSTQGSKPKVPETERKESEEILPALENAADKPMWLKDLFKLNECKNNSSSSNNNNESCNSNHHNVKDTAAVFVLSQPPSETVAQCCFCLHLFTSHKEMQEHIRLQHSENDKVLIKYTAPLLSKI